MVRPAVLLGSTLAGQADDNTVIAALGGDVYAIGDGNDTGRNAILRKELEWGHPITQIRRFYGLNDALPDSLDTWHAAIGKLPLLTVSQAGNLPGPVFTSYYEMASTTLWDSAVDAIADEIQAFIATYGITKMYFGYQHEAGADQDLEITVATTANAGATSLQVKTRTGVGVIKQITSGTVLNFGGGLTATVSATFTPTLPGGPFADPTTLSVNALAAQITSGHVASLETTAQVKTSFKNAWIKFHDRCVARWNAQTIAAIRWTWIRVDIDWETIAAIDWYPGDAYVDVCGLDFYNDYGRKNNGSWQEFSTTAALVQTFAESHGKVAGVAELGAVTGIPFTVTGGPYGPSGSPVTINISTSGGMVQAQTTPALVRFLDTSVVPSIPKDDVSLNANFAQAATSFQVDKLNVSIPTGTTGYVHQSDTTRTKGQFFTRMLTPLADYSGWEFVSYFHFNNEISEGPKGDAEALAGWVTLVNQYPFVPLFLPGSGRPKGQALPGSRSGLGPTGVRR